jgi:hypothetical protein
MKPKSKSEARRMHVMTGKALPKDFGKLKAGDIIQSEEQQWSKHTRFDKKDEHGKNVVEDTCPHGVGHERGIHGCDGCCEGLYETGADLQDEVAKMCKEARLLVWHTTFRAFFKWSVWVFILAIATFAVRMHYEFLATDQACKATAFEQLQEIVLTIRQVKA